MQFFHVFGNIKKILFVMTWFGDHFFFYREGKFGLQCNNHSESSVYGDAIASEPCLKLITLLKKFMTLTLLLLTQY